MRPRRALYSASAAVLALLVSAVALRTDVAGVASTRLATPEDAYAMAGGCYAVRAPSGSYLARNGGGIATSAGSLSSAEPFHFQATDLGQYLLYGTARDFLAASEGLAGEAAYAVTKSTPGQIAGGATIGATDAAADAIARGPAGTLTGRGASVVLAKQATELADWKVTNTGPDAFTFALPATGQVLAIDGQSLRLVSDAAQATTFGIALATGCTAFPEIEVNIDGPVATGETSFGEVRGMLDAHVHMMAFEFIGGRVRCGRPWHRYGVDQALVDCADHGPNGETAVLELALGGDLRHNPSGWPSFTGWPKNYSLTHEQIYYRWLERAWRGGLRLMTNLLVDNHALCVAYPFKRNSCNEMDGVRLQAQRIRELERYIDAQSGGPGEGWFRIVTDPFQARQVINSGKLAVVLGIEVSTPLDCNVLLDQPLCNEKDIDDELDAVYALGVRQMELVNKFDNALSGVTGDTDQTGVVVNTGNKTETGHYWRMGACPEGAGDAHDKHQINPTDSGAPHELTGRDGIFGAVLQASGTSGVAPVYPEGPHCNIIGLTSLGAYAVNGMIDRGMIFDPDHMSAKARHQALDILEQRGYSGVVSSHSWADDTVYPRVYELGGVVTPYAGGSTEFVNEWLKLKPKADPRFAWGFGYGSDVNGFGAQGAPRKPTDGSAVTYPFTGFGGTTVHKQVSGTRTYDVNTDGVAHYGLYPDWIEDLRKQAGNGIVEDMARSAEAYLQMWERSVGIAPDACRDDVADLTDADVAAVTNGMRPPQVLEAIGQPKTRTGSVYTYCMTGGRTATVTFGGDALVSGVAIA